jgi:hypothetical protein
MKQILLMIAVVALMGCGKKPAEESVFDQGRPDATKPSEPPAKTEAQIEAETKTFAETKVKAEVGDADTQLAMEEGATDYTVLILFAVFVLLLFVGACWAFGFGKILNWILDTFTD